MVDIVKEVSMQKVAKVAMDVLTDVEVKVGTEALAGWSPAQGTCAWYLHILQCRWWKSCDVGSSGEILLGMLVGSGGGEGWSYSVASLPLCWRWVGVWTPAWYLGDRFRRCSNGKSGLNFGLCHLLSVTSVLNTGCWMRGLWNHCTKNPCWWRE